MANRFAIATGNWSSGGTWDDGIGPIAGDSVFTNGYTVTINQNINVGYLSSAASPQTLPNIATPIMTSNNTPSGVAAASSQNGGNAAYLAFIQNYTTGWISTTSTGWLSYQYPTQKIIKRYLLRGSGSAGYNARTWTFEGSNDGTNWTILDSVSLGAGIPGNTSYISSALTNTTQYFYYRVNVTVGGGVGVLYINEFEMTELTATTYGQTVGGSFFMPNPYSITCTNSIGINNGGSTSTGVLNISANTGTINIVSNVRGGPTASSYGINILNSGSTINITGNTFGGSASAAYGIFRQGNSNLNTLGVIYNQSTIASAHVIYNNSIGTINLTGNLNANAGSAACFYNNANATINIVGSIFGSFSTNNSSAIVINNSVSTFNITGNINGSTVNSTNPGFNSVANATVNVNGNIIGGTGGSTNPGLQMTNGNLNVVGNVIGGTTANSWGINFAALTANVVGNVSGGTNVGGVNNTGSAFNLTGNCFASSTYSAIDSTTTTGILTISGSVYNFGNVNGVVARRLRFNTNNNMVYRLSNELNADYTFYPLGSTSLGTPSVTDVRSGTVYANGALTGTLIVPNPATVLSGVPTDNTVGTYSITPQILSDSIWNQPMTAITNSNSIGYRLKNASTVDTTAATVAAFNV